MVSFQHFLQMCPGWLGSKSCQVCAATIYQAPVLSVGPGTEFLSLNTNL